MRKIRTGGSYALFPEKERFRIDRKKVIGLPPKETNKTINLLFGEFMPLTDTSYIPFITSIRKKCLLPAGSTRASSKYLKPLAYGMLLLKPATNGYTVMLTPDRYFLSLIKSLKPAAYSLLLIFVSMFSLSDAWAQSVETRTAEGQSINENNNMIFAKIGYDYTGDTNIGLKVGDHIPNELWDMPLSVIYSNADIDTLNLRSFSDKKLIVIDFWSTWCGPCISSIEKWHTVFPKYKQDLAILTVHMDYDYKALPFISKRNWFFPVVIGQAQADLNRYFFDKYQVGGQVFIVDGMVAAICYTGESDLNKQHLDDLFKGTLDPINFVSTHINTY